jgi:NagD protein
MILLDVQGTLIDDLNREPIVGAIPFVASLKESKRPFSLITNNTKYGSSVFLSYLQKIGFDVSESTYIDPLMMLETLLPQKDIFAVGNEGFLDVLRSMGYRITKENPYAVVVSIKETLSYDDMADCVELILGGAKLIGMHQTALYAKNNRRYPGLGAVLSAIEYATGAKAIIVGKPSDLFYEKARQMVGAKSFDEMTIISDDPKGDLVDAKRLGMKTIFVLSGKYKNADEILPFLPQDLCPDSVVNSIKEVLL